jgi:hypothetical protein
MLISTGTLTRQFLGGRVALLTGANGGIRYAACLALPWLEVKTVLAGFNKKVWSLLKWPSR